MPVRYMADACLIIRRRAGCPRHRGPGILPGFKPIHSIFPNAGHSWHGAGCLCLLSVLASALVAAAADPPGRPWSDALLGDVTAWPHAERDSLVAATPQGLRVEVAAGHRDARAEASGLLLAADPGRIHVRVAQVGGGARWFVRLYGELRRPGEKQTLELLGDEAVAGEREVDIDPRLCQARGRQLQLQLGVEGAPGAFAVFGGVAFGPAGIRPNCQPRAAWQPGQLDIAAVELMPNLPQPFELIDWRDKARAYERLVFDAKARGEFLPLVWLDESHINLQRPTFGLPSYVGDPNQGPAKPDSQEGVTCMGAVLGATLVGVDMSRQQYDYVDMCEAWYNTGNGLNLVLNNQRGGTGGSFWYEMFTHIVFYALADRYPDKSRLTEIMRLTAERWRQASLGLADAKGRPDFNHTSYDFATRKPVDNGRWREPDAAAGMAWLQYAAWTKFHDPGFLAAAESSVQALQDLSSNPFYEVLLPYGTLTAARLNAELGRHYDVPRLLDWCFGVSDSRGGWGVLLGNWGGYDCDGLVGSLDNRGGYAFAMNTFAQAGALVPLARYQPQYARAIGKWMLNLTNSARLFYPGALPAGHETSAFWRGDPQHSIAYEGLRHEWLGMSPCATGDPLAMKWGPATDLGLYGSSYAGILGALVRPTTNPRILQLDCLATDFFRAPAYPTFLYYNPHPESRKITLPLGEKPVTVYDIAAKQILARNVSGEMELTVPADGAVIAVLAPAIGAVRSAGRQLLVEDIVVDSAWGPAPQ